MKINKTYYIMPYNSLAQVCQLKAERNNSKFKVKSGGFESQIEVSYMSSHTDDLWYNKTVCP